MRRFNEWASDNTMLRDGILAVIAVALMLWLFPLLDALPWV